MLIRSKTSIIAIEFMELCCVENGFHRRSLT